MQSEKIAEIIHAAEIAYDKSIGEIAQPLWKNLTLKERANAVDRVTTLSEIPEKQNCISSKVAIAHSLVHSLRGA